MRELRSATSWALIVGAAFWVGCSEEGGSTAQSGGAGSAPPRAEAPKPAPPAAPPAAAEPKDTRTEAEIIEAGRSVYNANCIACHSMDPSQDGALGPAVSGASYELLEARVIKGGYPEGYTPKRATLVMIALPHLERDVDELTAYLGSF